MTRLTILASLVVLLAACGDDAVSYSEPVGINLKAESGDVADNGTIQEQKGISTESGNPYAHFVSEAEAELGGAAPGRIEVAAVDLLLATTSTGVTSLEQVFAGSVDVQFVMNDTNNVYPVATIADPTGRGPVELTVQFEGASVAAQDQPKLLGGSFDVALGGTAATGFQSLGAKADLQLTFTFEAFE